MNAEPTVRPPEASRAGENGRKFDVSKIVGWIRGRSAAPGPRAKGSGGVFPIRPEVWRVDIELPREGRRRNMA